MRTLGDILWRLGGVCFILVFCVSLGLMTYYGYARPHVPDPAHGWNVRLTWTFNKPSYGTSDEYSRQHLLFWLGFASIGVLLSGEAIRKSQLNPQPRRKD